MIQHVALECRREDADDHRRFWAALGFTEVDPPDTLRDRSLWLQSGDTQIHLMWTDDPVTAGHVAIRVADLDALDLDLEERTPHWGERRVYARAPGGHTVELFVLGPGSDPQPKSGELG